MLTHPTLDKLQALKLMGMYQALMEQTCPTKRATTSFTLVGTSADFTLSVLIRRV